MSFYTVKALSMMKEHRSIEAVIEAIKGTKYVVPENFDYVRAREVSGAVKCGVEREGVGGVVVVGGWWWLVVGVLCFV